MLNRTLILAVVLSATASLAQNQVVKPNGIKIGDGRLHPFLTVRAAYDSAAGLFPSGGMTGPLTVRGDFILTPSAGLIFNLDSGNTMFNFNGGAGYTWYTGLITSGANQLSFISANVGLDAAFNRQGAVEFDIGDNFTRSNRSGNVAAGVGILSLFNSARVAAPIKPGGGAIVITPQVRWDVEFFTPQLAAQRAADCRAGDISCDPAVLSRMNYNNLFFSLGGKWKFLPKTAVIADVGFDWRTYFNTSPSSTGMIDFTTNLNAQLLRGSVGMSGLITSRISALATIGGGYDFGNNLRRGTVIAQAEVAYLGQDFTVRGGYMRTLNPVPLYGLFEQDRGYLEARATFFGRLTLRGFGSYDFIQFPRYRDPVTMMDVDRRDHLIMAQAEISYQFVSFFSASLTYWLSWRQPSSAVANVSGRSAVDYTRHEPALTLNLTY